MPKPSVSYLKGEILVWCHEADALEVVGGAGRALFLRELGKGCATCAFTYCTVLGEGRAHGRPECACYLIVGGSKATSICAVAEQAATG